MHLISSKYISQTNLPKKLLLDQKEVKAGRPEYQSYKVEESYWNDQKKL